MRLDWTKGKLLLFLALILILSSEPASNSLRARSIPEPPNPHVKRSNSAIAISRSGHRLLVVNPDSNSITLIDTENLLAMREIDVGIDPRSVSINDQETFAYVANRGSDTVSVIDLGSEKRVADYLVGAQPYGVLISPDGRFLFVAEQASGTVRVLVSQTGRTIRLYHLGEKPSGLALSEDGRTLYITHLLSNYISIIDMSRPYATYIPAIFTGPVGSQNETVAASIQASTTIRLWRDSNLVQSIVLAPDGPLAYLPHTRSNSSNPILSFDNTVLPLVSLLDVEKQEHLTGLQFDLGTMDPPGVGLPFDAAVKPDGTELWVLNAASNDISVVDLQDRQLVAHIEVGANPRGITISPDGQTAYVNNTLSGTLSVIDTDTYAVQSEIAVTEIPLPPLLLQGKKLFNSSDDPRMSNAQWIACSSCHFDGEHDSRTWNLSFAGPRNTTSLLGMIETYPPRWSGEWDESADAEFAIRRENFGAGLIEGDLHCDLFPANCVKPQPNQGRSEDLDALAAYMDSLVMPLSPGPRKGQPLSAAAQRGRDLFLRPDLGCVGCHPPPLYTDLLTHDVGTESDGEKISPAYDTPSLRGLYGSAPYFHDGSVDTLQDALTLPTPDKEHDLSEQLSQQQIQDLVQYLLSLPYK